MKLENPFKWVCMITICIFCIIGCVDEFDNFIPHQDNTNTFAIEALISPDEQSSTVVFNNAIGTRIITPMNTIIVIGPNSFFSTDEDIVNAEIKFEYLEIYSRGDKIKYNVPTISNGRIISSDGVFYFNASSNGKRAILNSNNRILVQVENRNPDPNMELFYQSEDASGNFDWVQADMDSTRTNTVQIVEFQDSTAGEVFIGYEFFSDSLKWINVDVFVDIPQDKKTEVCVELPEIYNNENTSVYLVFEDYNSVVALHAEESSSKFCEPYGAVPIGVNVSFVIISKQGEETYHFAMESATVERNLVLGMQPKETAMDEILASLDSL